jgi:hypothetical protein
MKLNHNNKEGEKERGSRLHILIATLIFLIVFSFFASISHRLVILGSDFLANVLPRVLVDLTNSERHLLSLNQLQANPLLEEAARRKAEDMARKSYFAHVSPEGLTPWHWFDNVGYNFRYAGENLAINFSDSNDVVKAWMNSPSHRANILSGQFTEIGIATAKGRYQGRETTFVVQMFGHPSSRPVVQIAQAEESQVESVPPAELIVLGESEAGDEQTESVLAQEESQSEKFIAVERSTGEVSAEEEQTPVVVVGNLNYSSLWEKTLASPSLLLGVVYTILGSVVIFLMFLALMTEIRRHHYLHIIYGTGLLILILVLYIVFSEGLGKEVEVSSFLLLSV